ncbi:hypothetical protein HID58_061618 [Brassica napus]|uniref:Uncharacterized protein n=1 Tax=Brassica napus TaxID=3708 RepID=A0ABQ7ZZ39_BRANA|nr:hypothetical protein HID58_061618 [Brassica napus]
MKINRVINADYTKVINGISLPEFKISILWNLDSLPFPSFQFGMAGAIYVKGVAVCCKVIRGMVISSQFFVELSFAKKRRFAIDLELSLRRFSKVRFLVKPVSVRPILEIGHDALLEPMTVVDLLKA